MIDEERGDLCWSTLSGPFWTRSEAQTGPIETDTRTMMPKCFIEVTIQNRWNRIDAVAMTACGLRVLAC